MVKYYKKVEVGKPWVQPILTSNGVFGGDKFAVYSPSVASSSYSPFLAFDGSVTTNAVTVNGNNHYIMYFPEAVNISNIKSVGYHDIYWLLNSYRIAYSDDNITYTNATNVLTTIDHTINANIEKSVGYHKYWKIIPITHSNSGWSVKELYVQAQELSYTWAECTQAEYDQLSENNRKIVTDIYNVFVRNSQQSTYRWKQPTLTSNGTIGDNSFAVTSTTATAKSTVFQMFDGKSDTFADLTVPHSTGINMVLYNSIPLNIKKIETVSKLLNTTYGYIGIRNGNVYGSNDGENYTLIKSYTTEHIEKPTIDLSDNKYYYKYYKITTDSWYTPGAPAGGYDYCQVVSMNITALTQEKILLNINKTYAPFSKVTDKVYKTFNSPEYTSEIQAQSGVNGIKFTPSNLYGMTNLSSYIRIPQNQKVIFELPDNLVRVNYVNHKGYSIGQVMPPSNINQVDVSNDGTNWTTVATYTMPTYGIVGDVTNQLDLPKIKYIRFNFWFHGSGSPSYYGSGGVSSVYINCLIREGGKEKSANLYYLRGAIAC